MSSIYEKSGTDHRFARAALVMDAMPGTVPFPVDRDDALGEMPVCNESLDRKMLGATVQTNLPARERAPRR